MKGEEETTRHEITADEIDETLIEQLEEAERGEEDE